MTLDSGLALAVCTWVTRGDERGQLSGEKWVLQALVFGSVTSAPHLSLTLCKATVF